MIQIRPVSDLRNKFPEIETLVSEGKPIYLTKNGYGCMVVLSVDQYAKLVDSEGFPPATHKEKNGERVPAVIETRDLTPAFAHHGSR